MTSHATPLADRNAFQSCGYSIPFFEYIKERPTLDVWARKRECLDLEIPYDDSADEEQQLRDTGNSITQRQAAMDDLLKTPIPAEGKGGLRQYWDFKNSMSLDGLPALSNLAPTSGSNTPEPYGRFENGNAKAAPAMPLPTVVHGKLSSPKASYTPEEVKGIVMRERRRMQSNWKADLYIWFSLLVLGLAIGYGFKDTLDVLLRKMV